jgi:hypothetical protein
MVDNALKFTPPGGQVGVRSFADDDSQGIEVTDTGPGIPLHHREDVLRRFYRTEDSRHTRGSGLGLALVAGVAGLHEMGSHLRRGSRLQDRTDWCAPPARLKPISAACSEGDRRGRRQYHKLLGTAYGRIALAKSGCFAAPAAGRRQSLRAD